MFSFRQALRWGGAVVVAVVVYIIVSAIGALIWQRFGGDPLSSVQWILAAATFCAVLTGTFIVPRENWKLAALTIWLLAIFYPASLFVWSSLSGHFSTVGLYEIAGTLIGGFPAYLSVKNIRWSALKTKNAVERK